MGGVVIDIGELAELRRKAAAWDVYAEDRPVAARYYYRKATPPTVITQDAPGLAHEAVALLAGAHPDARPDCPLRPEQRRWWQARDLMEMLATREQTPRVARVLMVATRRFERRDDAQCRRLYGRGRGVYYTGVGGHAIDHEADRAAREEHANWNAVRAMMGQHKAA